MTEEIEDIEALNPRAWRDWVADLGSDIYWCWPTEGALFRVVLPSPPPMFDQPGINEIYNHVSPDPETDN